MKCKKSKTGFHYSQESQEWKPTDKKNLICLHCSKEFKPTAWRKIVLVDWSLSSCGKKNKGYYWAVTGR